MNKFLKKEGVKEAFKKAKKLEEEKLLSEKDITKIHAEGMKQTSIMQRLLTKAWFIKDPHNKSPTRNKKKK